jgi:uncharacterized Zn finger protein
LEDGKKKEIAKEKNIGDEKMAKCPNCGRDEDDESIRKKIAPGDVLIISRQGDSFLIAENIDREIRIRKVKVEEEIKKK